MMMVMIVIGAAGVLAFGMAAASTMRTRVAQSAASRQQAQYLAESGLNLSIYYLKHPKASPVGVGFGENGNVHYRGEPSITVNGVPGTIATVVTNPANGDFSITSTGTFDGQTATATAKVTLKKSKLLTYAAYMAGTVKPSNRTIITGGLITNGSLQQTVAGQVTGLISTLTSGSSSDVASTDFDYPVSLLHYLPTYYYKGREYTAKVVSSPDWNGGAMSDVSSSNPLNIWYFRHGVKIKSTATITGTIVVPAGTDLEIDANLTAAPKGAFPSLVVPDNVVLTRDFLNVTVNGIAYIGNQVKVNGTLGFFSTLNFNGSLMSPRSGFPFSTSYKGAINLTYSQPKAKMEAFADEMEAIDSVIVTSWETDNARLQ